MYHDSDDEQLDQIENEPQQSPNSDRLSENFSGFHFAPSLRYRVVSDPSGEVEFVTEVDSEDHLELSQEFVDRAIDETGVAWRDIEEISDRLRALSPILDRNTEFELAQTTDSETNSQRVGITANIHNSLVSRRISFFDNMTSTVTSTTSTSTSTNSLASSSASVNVTSTLTQPISSIASVLGGAAHNWGLGGPGFAMQNQGFGGFGGAVQNQDSEAAILSIMSWLEDQVEFTTDDLNERVGQILEGLSEEDDSSELTKAAILAEMKVLESQMEEYKRLLQYKCATVEKERRRTLQKRISQYARQITLIKVAAGENGQQAAQLPMQPAHLGVYPQQKLAKVELLKLPRYGGEHSRYISFKNNFDRLIRCTNMPEDVWGNILYDHLDGTARKYIGSRGNWQGKYMELWDKLDSRYANRWTMAAETLKCSIMSTPPQDDWQGMIEYVDDQLDCIKSIAQLELTNEQLAVNVLLLKLPEDFANAIRNGIRIKRQDKGLQDYKFTPTEFRDVLNDTVVTWGTTTPHLTNSTTMLQTTIKQEKVEQQNSLKSGPTGNYSGGGKGRGRGHRGGSRGTGSLRMFGRPKCQLCDGEHTTGRCQSYLTTLTRRQRLITLDKCPECSRAKHDGLCKLTFKCRICNNGVHMDYLCPGLPPISGASA